jgi:hypothetical protein
MSLPRSSSLRRAVRWLVPAAALALAPKCLLCVLAYAGLASALGLGGRELCGGPAESPHAWIPLTAAALLVLGGVAMIARRHFRARFHHALSGLDSQP